MTALTQLKSPGLSPANIFELTLAGLLFAAGIRSLIVWLRTEFDAESPSERVLFALHAAARAGIWLSLAALFLGYAVVNEPQGIRWLALVPLALAGLQLLTGMALSRPSGRTPGSRRSDLRSNGRGVRQGEGGNARPVAARGDAPGPLEPEKRGETSEPGHPQPDAAEVESARILANEAREELRASGLTDRQIRQLADEFIALDRGEGLAEFIEWSKDRTGRGRRSAG